MLRLIFRIGFGALCLATALLPLIGSAPAQSAVIVPPWPSHWDGQPLHELPLTGRESSFTRSFPGRVAKFTDGRREFILRWVTQPTRQLHSSSDCFRGLGYSVQAAPAVIDPAGAHWSCFAAERGTYKLRVRERIIDARGGEWTDPSAWYWNVLLRKTDGPWLAITIVENATRKSGT